MPAHISRTHLRGVDYMFSSVIVIAVTEEFPVWRHSPRFAQGFPGFTTGCPTSLGPLSARHTRSQPCRGDYIRERWVAPSERSHHSGHRAEWDHGASAGRMDRCWSCLPVRHPGNRACGPRAGTPGAREGSPRLPDASLPPRPGLGEAEKPLQRQQLPWPLGSLALHGRPTQRWQGRERGW